MSVSSKKAHNEPVSCPFRIANVTLKTSLLLESIRALLQCIWWTQHLLPSCGNSFKLTIEGWITNKQNKKLQHWKLSNLLFLQLPCEFLWWNYLFLFNKNYVQSLLYLKCVAIVLFFNLCFLFVYKVHFLSLYNIQHWWLGISFLQKAFCVEQVYVCIFLMYFQSATLTF